MSFQLQCTESLTIGVVEDIRDWLFNSRIFVVLGFAELCKEFLNPTSSRRNRISGGDG